MKTIFKILIVFVLQQNVFAQYSNINEIENHLKTINNKYKHDTAKAFAYMKLSDLLYAQSFDTIKYFCDKAIEICDKGLKNNKKETTFSFLFTKASSLNNLGFYYQHTGNFTKAMAYFNQSLKLYYKVGLKKDVANTINNIASLYESLGKDSIAITYYNKSLLIFKSINDLKGIALSYNNLANYYQNLGGFKTALDFYYKSLKIRKKLKDFNSLAINYVNIGYLFMLIEDNKQVISNTQKGIKLAKKSNDLFTYAQGLNNLSIAYKNIKKYKEALQIINECLKIQLKINDKEGIAYAYNNKASVFGAIDKKDSSLFYFLKSYQIHEELLNYRGLSQTGINISNLYLSPTLLNKRLAFDYLIKSYQMAIKIGHPDLISDAAKKLSEYYEKEKEVSKSLNFYKIYASMKDSLLNRENLRTGFMKQFEFEFESKAEILKFEQKKRHQIAIKEKKINFLITSFSVFITFFILIFAFIIFRNLKKTKNQKKIIEAAHQHLEIKNQEILDSITYAKRIQSAILPNIDEYKKQFKDSFILYKPKDIVAGDFYWLEVVGSKILFAAADCTGHGVPGAMVSVVCNNGLNRSVREFGLTNPDEILNKTRELVIQEFEKSDENVMDGMDISLCAFDTKTNLIKWSGANNPLWILRNNEMIEYKPDKQPIGKYSNTKPFTLLEFQLEKNDIIYIFTDGFQDQFGGEKGKKFKAASMRELFFKIKDDVMDLQKKKIEEALENWKGNLEQVDDVCIIGIRI